jgi:hypothetical protein
MLAHLVNSTYMVSLVIMEDIVILIMTVRLWHLWITCRNDIYLKTEIDD